MENKNNVVHLQSRNFKPMETKIYQTAKEFFKFLNNYEADIWIRGSRAYNVNGELIAEYNTKF